MTATLYERIGGEPTIKKLITAFYQHVLADPMLQPFFEKTSIKRLEHMQSVFYAIALGGAEPVFHTALYESHQGRGS